MNVAITPAMVGQVVISGILAGALYSMVALGLALIFGVMRVINIAHGPLLMLGAYTTFFLHSLFGLNPYLSVPVTLAMLFVVGVVLQRTLVFRVVDPLPGSFPLGPFAVSKPRLVAFVFAAGVTGLAFLFLRGTRLGKAIRATSQSRGVAMVCGVDVQRVHMLTFGV